MGGKRYTLYLLLFAESLISFGVSDSYIAIVCIDMGYIQEFNNQKLLFISIQKIISLIQSGKIMCLRPIHVVRYP